MEPRPNEVHSADVLRMSAQILLSVGRFVHVRKGLAYLARKSSGEEINLRWQGVDTRDVSDELATREVMLKNLHAVRITLDLEDYFMSRLL